MILVDICLHLVYQNACIGLSTKDVYNIRRAPYEEFRNFVAVVSVRAASLAGVVNSDVCTCPV